MALYFVTSRTCLEICRNAHWTETIHENIRNNQIKLYFSLVLYHIFCTKCTVIDKRERRLPTFTLPCIVFRLQDHVLQYTGDSMKMLIIQGVI